ncbi:MAG: M48 family metallopeptidase [Acidobacteriia bacterium]|nr:M48 family metallopeptidase [Terriglobia bacterium]
MLKLTLIAGLALFLGAKYLPHAGSWLGLRSRKTFRQAKWMWSWVAGSEAESLQAEREYGRECAREFAAQFSGRSARDNQEVVASVGSRLAAAVDDPRRQFQFTVVVAPTANAFALPGGFVFITEALVDLCEHDEGELAFFLGHEMAHVLRGHAKDQVTASAFLNAVTARLTGAGLMLRQVLAKGYSRDLELEADREGARLAAAAGFDSRAAVRGLRRLAQASAGSARLLEYFSSHPPLAERLQRLDRASS